MALSASASYKEQMELHLLSVDAPATAAFGPASEWSVIASDGDRTRVQKFFSSQRSPLVSLLPERLLSTMHAVSEIVQPRPLHETALSSSACVQWHVLIFISSIASFLPSVVNRAQRSFVVLGHIKLSGFRH
jgi:hypothetical protein